MAIAKFLEQLADGGAVALAFAGVILFIKFALGLSVLKVRRDLRRDDAQARKYGRKSPRLNVWAAPTRFVLPATLAGSARRAARAFRPAALRSAGACWEMRHNLASGGHRNRALSTLPNLASKTSTK
ncbi:hypothetical protein R5W24_004045 [Gemmata sp. JC717]|uniref:hypothetical protein n=1 Tax=Gemmata algarum TaxID=2975278 RepID=UPI0021BB88B5|nr:hypothetical protein [Gemmata algarum]MDY3554913.1 hypothetical protein [Gemmata algarum]